MGHTIQHHRRRRLGRPAAPAAPTVTSRTSTQVVSSWASVAGASRYLLERSLDGGATWTQAYSGALLTYADTGLTAATSVAYRLSVETSAGLSVPSTTLSTSTTAEAAPPDTPTAAPTVDSTTANAVNLTGAAVTGATSYAWQRSSTSATTGFATVVGATARTLTDTGRAASTSYWYRYAAVNADGTSGWSPVAVATTLATSVVPAAPAQPTVSGLSSASVILTVPAVTGATSYVWQVSSTSATTGFATITGSTREVSAAGLAASTQHWARAAAASSAGTSAYSPVRTFTTTAPSSTTVQPVAARYVTRRAGFRTAPHENGATSVYKGANADEICRMAKDMGLSYVRGRYPGANGGGVAEWVAALKKYDLKWVMTIIPEGGSTPAGQTVAETRAKAIEIRDDPDLVEVCMAIEGLNEPNHNKGGGEVPANWAEIAHDHQVAFYNVCRPPDGSITSLSDKIMIGPSLQATFASNSYRGTGPWPGGARHYHQVVAAGTLDYMDQAGLHTYPNGGLPEEGLDFRITNIRDAFGSNYPVFISEWGYSAATSSTQGNPVTKAVSGIYIPRGFLQYIIGHDHNSPRRGHYFCLYEALDNWNPGKTDREAWFGAIGTSQQVVNATTTAAEAQAAAANWRNFFYHDAATNLKALLSPMQDPAGTAGYTPTPVTLSISTTATNLLWWCIANKAQSDAGTASVYMVKDAVHNAVTTNVTVTDRVGAQDPVPVGGEVVKVDLR